MRLLRSELAQIGATVLVKSLAEAQGAWTGTRLLPVSEILVREFGFLAFAVGVGGAAAGVHTFRRRGFGLLGFTVVFAIVVASALPFYLSRFYTATEGFAVIAFVAYLAFHGAFGALVGGILTPIWSQLRE